MNVTGKTCDMSGKNVWFLDYKGLTLSVAEDFFVTSRTQGRFPIFSLSVVEKNEDNCIVVSDHELWDTNFDSALKVETFNPYTISETELDNLIQLAS